MILVTKHLTQALQWWSVREPFPGNGLFITPRIPLLGKTNQEQGGSGGGHRHCLQLAVEILVPPIPPDDMQDPSPAPMQEESTVTTLAPKTGYALPHQPLNTTVDGVEAERHALHNKGFSDDAIRTILAATHKTSRKVYNVRLESFASWCSERGQNPVCASLKHIVDFLQLKSAILALNTFKGYVTAILSGHAFVQGSTLEPGPLHSEMDQRSQASICTYATSCIYNVVFLRRT